MDALLRGVVIAIQPSDFVSCQTNVCLPKGELSGWAKKIRGGKTRLEKDSAGQGCMLPKKQKNPGSHV
jgi:hypothetical protein